MKKVILTLITIPLFGCASVISSLAPVIPRVEMGAKERGFGLSVDPATLGIETFCLDAEGTPAKYLDKTAETPVVNIFTDFIKNDLFGVCQQLQDTQPEVLVE